MTSSVKTKQTKTTKNNNNKTNKHLHKISWENLEEIAFRLSEVIAQEKGKTDYEGFERAFVNEAKFPESPPGNLAKEEGSQYYVQVCCQNTKGIIVQGNRMIAVSEFTTYLGITVNVTGRNHCLLTLNFKLASSPAQYLDHNTLA